jgi:hypothetical protein
MTRVIAVSETKATRLTASISVPGVSNGGWNPSRDPIRFRSLFLSPLRQQGWKRLADRSQVESVDVARLGERRLEGHSSSFGQTFPGHP